MSMTNQARWRFGFVDVLKVGRLMTLIRVTEGGESSEFQVWNRELSPQPCGVCKGSGKLLLMQCRGCEGRGYDPNKNPAVDHLVQTAEKAFDAGKEAGARRRNTIDVEYTAVPALAIEEKPESFTLCAECLCADCDGSCE